MNLSNFKVTKKTGQGIFATVDVTTPRLFWKAKTEQREICLSRDSIFWIFADTGEFTPGFEVENLYKVWKMMEPQP